MIRFSAAKGRKVVSTSTAATVGQVHTFVVDPKADAVIALRLKKTSSGDALSWSDITGFGEDAVTVAKAELITEANAQVAARSEKAHRVLGKRVLTVAGDELGEVDDVEFDPKTGGITALVLDDGELARGRLVGVGSYAVVVEIEPRA